MIPLDPCGMVVSWGRHCGQYDARFYSDSDQTARITYYVVPAGTPALPFPHSFGCPEWFDPPDTPDPIDGQVGVLQGMRKYDKGIRPPGWRAPTRYCGRPRQWLAGSDSELDPPLDWRNVWASTCCRPDLVTLPARASLLAAGKRTVGGRALLAGSSSLTARPTGQVQGRAQLQGTSQLRCNAHGKAPGEAFLPARSQIIADGTVIRQGAALLPCGASLTATGKAIRGGAAQLQGTASVLADGTLVEPTSYTTSFSGRLSISGDFTDSSVPAGPGNFETSFTGRLSISGDFTDDSTPTIPGSFTTRFTGRLSVSGEVTEG